MPLSRSLYQYSCRGFICKSCVSKVLCPRPPWASRNITNDSREPKGAPKRVPQSSQDDASQSGIKFFTESADGTRVEVDNPTFIDPEKDAPLLRSLHKKLAKLEKNFGKLKGHETVEGLDLSLPSEEEEASRDQKDDKSEEREVARQLSAMTDEQRKELLAGMNAMVARLEEVEESTTAHPAYNFDMILDGVPNDHALRLRRFMQLLKKTALGNDFTPDQQQELWKHYNFNRRVIREMRDKAPPDLWTFLWTVLAKTAIVSPQRLGRLKILAEDMQHAGITLQDTQMLVYLEACYLEHRKEALDKWRSLVGVLGKKKSAVFKQYWELGTKMLVVDGHPQEALEAATVLFRGAPDANPRIIIAIIAAWTTSNDDKRMLKAWALYQRVRSALSSDIEMKDFDAVAAIFLGADQAGLALGVFRDMMAMGDQQNEQKGASTPVLEDVFDNSNLEVTSERMRDIDWTAFETLAYLPRKKRNSFFFGSWIKKLLGEKDVTAALQVLDLMRQYRVRPYAIQLNGVVGALLRNKTPAGFERGEQIGWEMIKARMEFLAAKQRFPVLENPARPVLSAGKEDFQRAVGDLSCTPPATAETVALLIESYRRRDLHHYIQDLWMMMETLQLRPNTFILNELLLSHYKARDPRGAMEILHQCVDIHHVKPDLYTIKWLWEHLKQRKVLSNIIKNPPSVTSARRLFAFTVNHLPPSITTLEEKALMTEIYNVVILCFGLVDDQVGTAIAMRTFQKRYDFYPQEETQRKIVAQAAASKQFLLGLKATFPYTRPRKGQRNEIQSVLNGVIKKRSEELKAQGIDLTLMDEKAKGEETLNMLTELLKSLYVSKTMEIAEAHDEVKARRGRTLGWSMDQEQKKIQKRNIEIAANAMGVPDIRPWSRY